MWLNSAVASKLQSWESQKSCYEIHNMTMAECQTVTVTTVVVTVTVVMVVEVVVKSTKSTTSPLWGIENSVMASNMFKHVQTYPEIIKRSWKTTKKTKPHSQVAIVEAIHRCVGASWQNDDFVVCLCAQSSFASRNICQIALPIPWIPLVPGMRLRRNWAKRGPLRTLWSRNNLTHSHLKKMSRVQFPCGLKSWRKTSHKTEPLLATTARGVAPVGMYPPQSKQGTPVWGCRRSGLPPSVSSQQTNNSSVTLQRPCPRLIQSSKN